MALLSLTCGLFGCRKAPQAAKHTLSDITAVSISCGHMDRSCCYSFCARKEADVWLLDAECFTQSREAETAFKGRELSGEETDTLLALLEQGDSIAYAESYKKPRRFRARTADETKYGFCLSFSDGNQFTVPERQGALEEFFYRLAEKYGN